MPSAAAQDVLQAILEQRAAQKRRAMAGVQGFGSVSTSPAAAAPMVLPFARQAENLAASKLPPRNEPLPFAKNARDWWDKSTFFKPAYEDLVGGLTAPGDVMSGAQPTMAADPQTGEFHTDPRLMDRAGALAGSVTLGAGAIPAEENALRMGIKAYHGSPHDFEAFDASKIGTGQGAKSFGHGLYAAENEAVARDYRDQLSKARSSFMHPDLGEMSRDQLDDVLLQEVKRVAPSIEPRQADMMAVNTVDALENGDDFNAMRRWVREQGGPPEDEAAWFAVLKKAQEFKAKPAQGRMYEVDIAAEPHEFLDWDKPLSEQSPQVREAMEKAGYSSPQGHLPPQHSTIGATAGRELQKPEEVARLREAGIPGVKYLDEGSRTAGEGTRNYVIFPGNERLISILKKYGLPISAAGLAALSQLHPQEAQAAQPQNLPRY